MNSGAKSENTISNSLSPVGAGVDTVGERGGSAGNGRSAFQCLPAWQRERCLRLHKICLGIEDRINRGQTLDRAVRYFTQLNRDRFYHAEPGRKVQFCYQTILRLLYLWRSGGRRPEAVSLRYATAIKVRDLDVAAFIRAAARPNITSFAEARAAMRATEATSSAFWYALHERTRRALLRAFVLRREAIGSNRRAAKMIQCLIDKL